MISSKLMGGLGNQMFQISCAVSLAKSNNETYGFDFENCYTPNQGYKSSKYLDSIFKNLPNVKNFNFKNIYHEPKFSFSKIPYQKNLLLSGYFQSEKYFSENKDFIKSLFVFDNMYFEKIKNLFTLDFENTTCIHIRRGDYLKFKDFHLTCDSNYYNKAMSLIDSKNYIFISDDIDWVKKNFGNSNFTYSETNDEILDFCLMLLSKNIIISNSSYGWWGAYLNNNKNKTIISPKLWFGPKGPKDFDDVIPNDWIKI